MTDSPYRATPPVQFDDSILPTYHRITRLLPSDDARMALDCFLTTARVPVGVLLTIKSVAEGMGSAGYGWHRIGVALIEMLGAGRAFSAMALRNYAEKVPEATVRPAAASNAADWHRTLADYGFAAVGGNAEAQEAFGRATLDGRFADPVLAWRALQEINPTGPHYRGQPVEMQVAWIEDVMRRHPDLALAVRGGA